MESSSFHWLCVKSYSSWKFEIIANFIIYGIFALMFLFKYIPTIYTYYLAAMRYKNIINIVTDSLFPTSRYKYIYYYENVRGNSVNNNALSKRKW